MATKQQMSGGVKVFLIGHTNSDGTGMAQATVFARNKDKAQEKFEKQHPDRKVTVVADRDQAR